MYNSSEHILFNKSNYNPKKIYKTKELTSKWKFERNIEWRNRSIDLRKKKNKTQRFDSTKQKKGVSDFAKAL